MPVPAGALFFVKTRRRQAVALDAALRQKTFDAADRLHELLASRTALAGVAVDFLTEAGRLVARVAAPGTGNVLLRREQFRKADDPAARAAVARCAAGMGTRCGVLRGVRAMVRASGLDSPGLGAGTRPRDGEQELG